MSRALFVAALLCAAPAAAETRFFSTIDDVPLAPGLAELGGGFYFEDAGGRVAGAAAHGRAASAAVRSFYVQTLPALGWSLSPGAPDASDLVFLRGRERLTLAIAPAGADVTLEARLFTRPAATNAD